MRAASLQYRTRLHRQMLSHPTPHPVLTLHLPPSEKAISQRIVHTVESCFALHLKKPPKGGFLIESLLVPILPCVAERFKAVLTEDFVDADGDRV